MSAPSNREPLDLEAIREQFGAHTRAIADFLGELYGIMVDPTFDGEIKVAEMQVELRDAALLAREHINALQAELAAERRKVERVEKLCCELERRSFWGDGADQAITGQQLRAAIADEEATK